MNFLGLKIVFPFPLYFFFFFGNFAKAGAGLGVGYGCVSLGKDLRVYTTFLVAYVVLLRGAFNNNILPFSCSLWVLLKWWWWC